MTGLDSWPEFQKCDLPTNDKNKDNYSKSLKDILDVAKSGIKMSGFV